MRRILFAACMLMLISLLFGCAAKYNLTSSDNTEAVANDTAINPSAKPLVVYETEEKISGVTAVYPNVTGSVSDKLINDIIASTLNDLVREQSSKLKSVGFTVCYNDRGIFSVLFEGSVKNSDAKRYKAVTINTASGKRLALGSFFKSGSAWEKTAEFYIAAAVKLKGTETFARLNVNENKGFFLTDDKLYMLYETYEYTYYNGGDTLFPVPYVLFDNVKAQGGAIAVITGKD